MWRWTAKHRKAKRSQQMPSMRYGEARFVELAVSSIRSNPHAECLGMGV